MKREGERKEKWVEKGRKTRQGSMPKHFDHEGCVDGIEDGSKKIKKRCAGPFV